MISLTIIILMSFGKRGRVIGFVVVCTLLYNYYVKSLKFSRILIIIIVFMITMGSITVYRVWMQEGDIINLLHALQVDGFDHNIILADVLMHVPEDVSFRGGNTYLNVLYYFIPRAIWPDKPTLSAGEVYKQERSLIFVGGGLGIGYLGELYFNFGWLGILLGSLGYGLLGGVLANYTPNLAKNPCYAAIMSVGIVSYLFLLRSDMGIIIDVIGEFVGIIGLFFISEIINGSLTCKGDNDS
jgi:hypothetical protein